MKEENIIELDESMIVDHAKREWLYDYQAQARDFEGPIRFVRGLIFGVVFSAVILAILAMCSGCTMSISIDAPAWSGPVDGGGEPMGWENKKALNEELERK